MTGVVSVGEDVEKRPCHATGGNAEARLLGERLAGPRKKNHGIPRDRQFCC